jgi:DNA processing protein
VTSAADILDDLNLKTLPQQQQTQILFGDSPEETAIIKLVSYEPILVNDLIKLSGLNAAAASTALTFLEMKGKIRNVGGQQYILSR